MKQIHIDTVIDVYDSIEELDNSVKSLMQKAISARKKAYAPYSKFEVGAAIELENGEIILGNNQENAAYPSGLCAERVAIFQAGALYPNVKIKSIAISATSLDKPVKSPIPPCGACRQSIAEYEQKQNTPIPIYFMGFEGPVYKTKSLENILPLTFDKSFL
jgi:cytidine deaminase